MSESKRAGPGRPPVYKTAAELEKAIDGYRAQCLANEEPMSITGLVLHLGFRSKQSYYNQVERDGEGWQEAVEYGSMLVEHSYEKNGAMSKIPPAVAIFALKNFGWKDKQEIEHSGNVDIASSILAARNRASTDEDPS